MSIHNSARRKFLQTAALIGAAAAFSSLLPGCGGGGGGSEDGSGNTLSGLRAIDAHAHPDQFYALVPSDNSSTLAGIKSVAMAASAFAAIGDLLFRTTGNTNGDEYNSSRSQLGRVIDLENQGRVKIVRTTADIPMESSVTTPPGAILSLEGGGALMGDLDKIQNFYDLGVRIITLVHYGHNQLGDNMSPAVGSGPANGGLTGLGASVVSRMESLGMVVDVAHASTQTVMDICARAQNPVIDSHTSLHPSLNPSSPTRLRTMAEMELIAGTGGLICLWPLSYGSRSTIDNWAGEISTIKSAIGIEHIALGTDGGGALPSMVSGYQSITDLPKLANAMLNKGLTENEVKAFLGGNMLRILSECIG